MATERYVLHKYIIIQIGVDTHTHTRLAKLTTQMKRHVSHTQGSEGSAKSNHPLTPLDTHA